MTTFSWAGAISTFFFGLSLLTGGCVPETADAPARATSSDNLSQTGAGGKDANSNANSATPASPAPAVVTPPLDNSPVCVGWRASRQAKGEGEWIDGNRDRCQPGDVSEDGRQNALSRVNYYRSLAGLAPVAKDDSLDAKAQSCALLLHANGKLSHEPPPSWSCWNKGASDAAHNSLLANIPGVMAVDGYMVDGGNDTTLGHRRWILSQWLDTVGLGSVVSADDATGGMSCMWVSAAKAKKSTVDWVAWPPPGTVPFEIVKTFPGSNWPSMDDTGWSIQSDTVNLSKAEFIISANGKVLPVVTHALTQNYGSKVAMSAIPQGWKVEAGTTYSVEIKGVATPIRYEVTFVRCEAP